MNSDYLYIPYNEEIICKYSKELPDRDKLSDLFYEFAFKNQPVDISNYKLYSQILWHINTIIGGLYKTVEDKESLFKSTAIFCVKESYDRDYIPPTEYLYELYAILHDVEKVKEFLWEMYFTDISYKI